MKTRWYHWALALVAALVLQLVAVIGLMQLPVTSPPIAAANVTLISLATVATGSADESLASIATDDQAEPASLDKPAAKATSNASSTSAIQTESEPKPKLEPKPKAKSAPQFKPEQKQSLVATPSAPKRVEAARQSLSPVPAQPDLSVRPSNASAGALENLDPKPVTPVTVGVAMLADAPVARASTQKVATVKIDLAARKRYQTTLMASLLRHRRYPRLARKRGLEGQLEVQFEITSAGTVISRQIFKTSGVKVLDDAALAMIDRAAPLPTVPTAYGPGPYVFTIPLNFQLE